MQSRQKFHENFTTCDTLWYFLFYSISSPPPPPPPSPSPGSSSFPEGGSKGGRQREERIIKRERTERGRRKIKINRM